MKVINGAEYPFDPSGNLAPRQFYGSGVPSTERWFTDAPIMSEYFDVTNNIKYMKTANNKAAADWKPTVVIGSTITGDVTITGTLTAGAVTAAV